MAYIGKNVLNNIWKRKRPKISNGLVCRNDEKKITFYLDNVNLE